MTAPDAALLRVIADAAHATRARYGGTPGYAFETFAEELRERAAAAEPATQAATSDPMPESRSPGGLSPAREADSSGHCAAESAAPAAEAPLADGGLVVRLRLQVADYERRGARINEKDVLLAAAEIERLTRELAAEARVKEALRMMEEAYRERAQMAERERDEARQHRDEARREHRSQLATVTAERDRWKARAEQSQEKLTQFNIIERITP